MSTGSYHEVHLFLGAAKGWPVNRPSWLWAPQELGQRPPNQIYGESPLLGRWRLLLLVGPGMGITKRGEGRRLSSCPSPGCSPCGKAMTSDISWLCRVSDVMSDLSNHTVIIHTH